MNAHRVTARDGGRVRFLLVQGVGTYDYCPQVEDSPPLQLDAARRRVSVQAEASAHGDSNMAKTTIVADEIGGSYSTTTVHATSAAASSS